MDDFCGNSSFWDSQLTWNSNSPDFTPCFEVTVLTWIPCAFLWFFSIFGVINTIRSPSPGQIPITLLIICKVVVTWALIAVHVASFSFTFKLEKDDFDISSAERSSAIIKVASYLLTFVMLLLYKTRGKRTSGVIFLFWFLTTLCEVFPFQTAIRNEREDDKAKINFQIQVINFPLVVVMLFLNCWADAAPQPTKPAASSETNGTSNGGKENGIALTTSTEVTYNFGQGESSRNVPKPTNKPCPEASASYLSKLVFFWFESLAWKGWRNPLVYEDLWELNEDDLSNVQYPIYLKNWKKVEAKNKGKPVSVFRVLVITFGTLFLTGASLKLVQDCLTFVPPRILKLLINYVGDKNEETWKGFFYVGILFATSIVQTIFLAQYFHLMFVLGMRIKASLTSAIYRKSLRISNAARKESTVGEIVNLMSVDTQRLMDLVAYLNMMWSAPLQIALSLYFLWEALGPSVLAGVTVMVLLIPVNGWITGRMKTFHIQQMKNKDGRVKLMSEILSGIKVLKLYAWEPSFQDQVGKIRGREMVVLKKSAYLQAVTSFLWFCAPFVVALVTFATYVLVDENNVLDSEKAFVSLSLFNIMAMPMSMLPMIIVMSAEASVSLKRLGKYLNAEEIDENAVEHESNDQDSIVIEDGKFTWDDNTEAPEPPTLSNINIRVKPGSLVACVGTVGSGKSSLLSAILGEMIKVSGRVVTKGSIAYVAQQAWIRNSSLKDNILFGKDYDIRKYKKIIDGCALQPDLDILPGGDQTEIGEKGVNLSGGQKQRVSLARSCYSNADVYLFDDPLSAVDAHVGKHIFEKVIGPTGLLSKKTRLLVTHGITYLPQVDHIIVLKDGQVSEEGTYKELLAKKGAFADFLVQHLGSDETHDEELSNVVMELEQALGGKDKILARQQSQISDDGGSGDFTGRRRTTSIRSQDSGNTPSPAKRMSLTSSMSTPKKEAVDDKKDKEKLIEQEKAETGSVKGDVYTHYFKAVGWPLMLGTLVFNALAQALQIGTNAWLSRWSEEGGKNSTVDRGTRDMYLGVYAALGVGQSIAVVVGAIVMAVGMLKAAAGMHNIMLINVLKSPASFFDTTPLGRIVNRFAKDVDVVDNQLPLNVKSWLRCLFQVVGTIAVISYSTPFFLIAIVPLGIVYILVQRFYVATSRQLKRLESVSRSPIYSHFSETLAGAPTIRAYSKQLAFVLESEAKVDYNQQAYFPSIVANRWLAVRLETVGNLIILFAGLFAVLGRDTLDAGTVGLSVSYALSVTQTLNWLVRMTSDVETNIVAVERLKEYSETPQEAEWEIPERKPGNNWPEKGMITFDKYQTRYREGLDLVLRDVTCTIEPGEKVGIVGRTGAGKSSLTLALFRMVEATGGSITIDGQNISKLGLHDVRGRLTIIPQDPVLFSGTLRFNLDPFERYTDDEIFKALELAHLKTFVSGLTAGLSHEINEGGDNLSVGQRQLVCLARALLRKTQILVLDEASSSVDLETDDLIQETIRSAFKECTILTIAHRLNTIMDSTRVMVLDKGVIKEFDTPSALLRDKNSMFYGLAKDAGISSVP